VLPKSFSYEEAEKRKQAEKDDLRRRYEDEIKRAHNEANEKNEKMARDKDRRRQDRERNSKKAEADKREKQRQEAAEILRQDAERRQEERRKKYLEQQARVRQADLRVFGVDAESWKAMTRNEQKKLYRGLALKYHSDKDKGGDASMIRINEALDRLLKPKK
tara:strand:- start:54 stop:539 length:486 start_codon:yes stop_codon:yes gene_type:complete